MKFTTEPVTLLRDQHNYIRALVIHDGMWYAVGPLGVPAVKPLEIPAETKAEAKAKAKAMIPKTEWKGAKRG